MERITFRLYEMDKTKADPELKMVKIFDDHEQSEAIQEAAKNHENYMCVQEYIETWNTGAGAYQYDSYRTIFEN